MAMIRTDEEVQAFLERAKLDRSDLQPVAQPLWFAQENQNTLRLLEVDKELLKTICEGERLVFRGEEDSPAVVCTGDRTFEVREADISNSLLLVPTLRLSSEVVGNADSTPEACSCQVLQTFHSYLELRQCFPRLKKLLELLRQSPYKGAELEHIVDDNEATPKYTLGNILERVQASEAEIRQAIEELPVVEIDGFYRLLDGEYYYRVQNFIINYIESESIQLDKIPAGDVVDKISELEPREVVAEVFRRCTTPNSGDEFYTLNGDIICKATADVLLRSVEKFNLSEFLEVWQNSVPEGVQTNIKQLEGLALTDRTSTPECIYLFDKWDLPDDANERFDILFRTKERWTLDEIKPYIEDLCVGQKGDANALLMRHARAAMRGGVRTYTSKRPIR
ncbi:sister chromatid cohesion protein DCC1 [Dermacentor silvarum]|uniref:sister chromatid cohesion protein DCC1 n=1 Tax=Dermacentor silvarum TaxID=543639 RepID=UPI001898F1E7|nr:sister chromatid cohesion protein DCC1 [Dermacentor silvarum]